MKEYIRYFAEEKGSPFTIEISGKSWCDGSYHIFRENPQIWVLEYILSGKGTVRCTDGAERVFYPEEGDVYLLPVNKKHQYFSDANKPWKKIFVNCKGSVVDNLAEAYGLEDKILFAGANKLEPYFQEIYMLMKDKKLNDKYVLEQTEVLIHKIFRGLWELTRHTAKESEEIWRVRQYLDEHVGELVTVREMSGVIYRSPDYLIKHFKEEVGVTPYQYLLKRKMTIAEKLLADTVLPVKEVAEHLGYEDSRYFSGLFRKEKGVSPRQFRKNLCKER